MFSQLYLGFGTSLIVSLIAIGAVIFLATKYNIYPKSSFRRPGQTPVPLLGGIAVYLGVISGTFFLDNDFLRSLVIASVPLVLMGSLDDIIEVRARTKLIGQVLAAVLWIGLISPSNLLFTRLGIPPIFGAAITFIFLLALMNAYNFLDGIDAHVGGMACIVLVFIALGEPNIEPLAFMLLAATVGFLCFNVPPAKIYLGETGSSFLGFSIGALCTLIGLEAEVSTRHFLGIIFFCSLPFCDLLVTIGRRLVKGLAPWSPDRDHFHHKMIKFGLSVPRALFISHMITFFAALTGYALIRKGADSSAYITAFVAFGLLTFIYASILLINHFVARKVSTFGRSLIEKNFPLVRSRIPLDIDNACILFDLLPYYEEVQSKGIMEVEKFVRDISIWAKRSVKPREFRLVGSYSVLMVLGTDFKNENSEITRMSEHLFEALLKLGAVKNLSMPPEGFKYFESLRHPDIQSLLRDHLGEADQLRTG